MRVRKATPADAEAVRDVVAAAAREAYGDVLDGPTLRAAAADPSRTEAVRCRLAEARAGDAVISLVAERDSVVGYLRLVHGDGRPPNVDGEASLQSLFVRPADWNEGVGTDLLAAGVDRLPGSVERVRLSVLAANDVGKRFYERRGFERVGTGSVEVDGTSLGTERYARDRR